MQKMKSSARFEFADSACDSSKAWKNPPLPGASPIEELIEDVRNGRAVILVDTAGDASAGDIVVSGQFATHNIINFMAKHGCGLICLAITSQRAAQMRLTPMASGNRARAGAAFTVSIEAREGVTTGISAADRARTIAVAIDPDKGPDDLVSPGHVFPLVARDGGVLSRQGRAEAAVDISRLVGHDASGVICEVLCDNGNVARMPALIAFAQKHGLKFGTIADLAAYRRRIECRVQRILDCPFDSVYGDDLRLLIYRNMLDLSEHVVLTRGHIEPGAPTMVRIHQLDLEIDFLGRAGTEHDHVPRALKMLSEYEGAGAVVFVRDTDPPLLSKCFAAHPRKLPTKRTASCELAREILRDLQIGKIVLVTSNNFQLVDFDGFEDSIVERRSIDDGDFC